MNATDFDRPVLLHVCKDGTITYRRVGQPVFNDRALPFFSVNTEEEARNMQVLMCAAQHGPHPDLLTDETWYRHWQFSGEVEDIDTLSDTFREAYERIQSPA